MDTDEERDERLFNPAPVVAKDYFSKDWVYHHTTYSEYTVDGIKVTITVDHYTTPPMISLLRDWLEI